MRARSSSPERLKKIESKVKQNLRSQVKAKARKNGKRELWGQEDSEIVRELSSGKKFSEIATAQKYKKSNCNSLLSKKDQSDQEIKIKEAEIRELEHKFKQSPYNLSAADSPEQFRVFEARDT